VAVIDQAAVLAAAECVINSVDWEADSYEAQSPAEDWALYALGLAIRGDTVASRKLMDAFAGEDWEIRRLFDVTEPELFAEKIAEARRAEDEEWVEA
jgi:hypothetical protein